ncbi:hypothetical protein ACLVWQ_04600 [Streptomyces sp. CWNU-52B]|uniref:hypothetical protein n=1 Tax=unclassified Streptomyces TaxID=2593676 RepID=UPI0039BF8B68
MSEVESAATELKSQYAAQVSADLDRNTTEQERISAEVAALEEQLRALRHDQSLLAELRRALGGEGPAPVAPSAKKGSAPAPSVPRQATATAGKRKKATATKPVAKPTAARATATKPAAAKPADKASAKSAAPKTAARSTVKSAAVKPAPAKSQAAKPADGGPTLVELIREHLGRQSEPRSSAELSTALTEAHPEREIKPKVVRTTVEGLVARGQVQRTKQGSSVFYTASTSAPAGTDAGTATEKAPDTAS